MSNQFATNAKDCYPETLINASALIDKFEETKSNDAVDKTADAVISAQVTEVVQKRTLVSDPSVVMSDDVSDTELNTTEQEQDLETDSDSELYPLKAAVMAAVLNGTLEDQRFLDDDD